MKKFLFACIVLLAACQKQNPEQLVQQQTSAKVEQLTPEQQHFLLMLREKIRTVSERDDDPSNSNNPFDAAGVYYSNMVQSVYDQEQINPSSSKAELQAKFTTYTSANPYNFFQAAELNELFEVEILTLMRAAAFNNSSNSLSISQLKAIENAIVESPLFGSNSKGMLLSFSASSKYWLDSQAILGSIFSVIMEAPLPEGFWDCVEESFALGIHEDLFSWDTAPAHNLTNWMSFPTTMVTIATDSMWACS